MAANNFGESRIYEKIPEEGVEPSQPCGRWILNPLRLPFRHSGLQGDLLYLNNIHRQAYLPLSARCSVKRMSGSCIPALDSFACSSIRKISRTQRISPCPIPKSLASCSTSSPPSASAS